MKGESVLFQFSIKRLWRDPVRNILFCVILFYPLIEIVFFLKNIIVGDSVLLPDYSFFLMCKSAGIGHMFQSLLLWFMPLYCLLLTADDCIEDYKIGLRNIIISKIGKKKYVQSHLIKSFLYSFILILGALMINLLINHIIFRGGQFSPFDDEGIYISKFYEWEVLHPLLTNVIFSVITSFVCGLISMVGTISAIMIHNKKIVYGITMVLWFVPFLQRKSLMYLFQPHSEYVLDTIVPIGISVSTVYLVYIILGYFKEVYFGKTSI